MIHGEDDFDSDSDIDVDIADDGGGKGGGGCGLCGGPGNADTENGAADSRTRLLGRGFVRVQWYPNGVKQDVHETKVILKYEMKCYSVYTIFVSLLPGHHAREMLC